VPAHLPRVPRGRHLGELAYREEYECEFVETRGQVFSEDVIQRAFTTAVQPLWPGGVRPGSRAVIGRHA
jgi:hypothetical protein